MTTPLTSAELRAALEASPLSLCSECDHAAERHRERGGCNACDDGDSHGVDCESTRARVLLIAERAAHEEEHEATKAELARLREALRDLRALRGCLARPAGSCGTCEVCLALADTAPDATTKGTDHERWAVRYASRLLHQHVAMVGDFMSGQQHAALTSLADRLSRFFASDSTNTPDALKPQPPPPTRAPNSIDE